MSGSMTATADSFSAPNGRHRERPSLAAKQSGDHTDMRSRQVFLDSNNNNNDSGHVVDKQSKPAANEQTTESEQRQQPQQQRLQQEQQPQQQQQQQGSDCEPAALKRLALDLLLVSIKTVISLYDLVTLPIYYFHHRVYRRKREAERLIRSEQFDANDPSSAWHQVNIDERHKRLVAHVDSSYQTYDELIGQAISNFANDPCYAYRRVLHEQWVQRADLGDKLQRQVRLSHYHWVSFAQFGRQIEAAMSGFLLEGVRPGHKVVLYADTRPEWQIVSNALVKLGAIVVTMYSTLGLDGIVHCVNETEVSLVVAQKDKVERLLGLKDKLPTLKRIIYLDGSLGEEVDKAAALGSDLSSPRNNDNNNNNNSNDDECLQHPKVICTSFKQLLSRGNNEDSSELKSISSTLRKNRTKDSLAIIMYTSGSTGIPKGVLISHGNILATIKAFSYVARDIVRHKRGHIFAAYLPLAHIFEFCFESLMLFHGVAYGFGTPQTLTDKSPGLAPGQIGDLSLLKPTVLIIVPLVLDRINQAIKQGLRQQPYFKRKLLNHLLDYKMYWQRNHYETPLVNKIVCSKLNSALGGQAKFVICGSAPLAGETQIFSRAALNLKLPQGFGTTETCAATSCQLADDQSTTNVGVPVDGASIKLEAWEEGNYRPTDKPNPRGEIVVGGEMIALGYFKLDEQTAEAFYVDNKGIRWYRTGDIGEFLPDGKLRIIDRKKDLVKMQNGEFISLGKIESTLKSNPYTENFCVYANSAHNFLIALGPASELGLRTLARQIVESTPQIRGVNSKGGDGQAVQLLHQDSEQLIEELADILAEYDKRSTGPALLERLCANQLIQERALASITQLARQRNLAGPEVPRKLLLIPEEWTEDKNLVTAAMKIRRNYIYKRYEHELSQIHGN